MLKPNEIALAAKYPHNLWEAHASAMNMKLISLLGTILYLAALAFAAEDWITREKIRAGWIYHSDGADKLAFFKQHGLNALITSAGSTEQDFQTFLQWAQEAKRVQMRLFGVVGASFDGAKAGLRRCVFGNGYESILPCPLERRYWEEVLTSRALRLAEASRRPELEISGCLIDWEMYANADKGGQIYYTDACYCDACWGGFLQAQGLPDVSAHIPFAQRVAWLREHKLFEQYHPYLQKHVREYAAQMRERILAVNPHFFLGFYPVPHNWHLQAVAQGLGKPEHPLILWATSTYGGGGPSKIPDNWQQEFFAQEIYAYYCGGMLLRFYSAANLAKNIFEIARKTNGYWLFTVHTLCIPEEAQSGDYYLAAGSPFDYLREIKRANEELDKLAADFQYVTPLEYVAEPVRYRHVGFDVNRYKPPQLTYQGPTDSGEMRTLPALNLTGSNFLLLFLSPDTEASLVFEVKKPASGDIWGVSYAVLNPQKQIVQNGQMPPGQEYTIKCRAPEAGLYAVVLTAGYYGCAVLKRTNTPCALWTGSRFEVSGPGGTLYFYVPEGLREFTISAQCEWGTSQINLCVLNPEGEIIVQKPTDPYERKAKLVVPTNGKSGQWALRAERIEGQSFRSVRIDFDKALPPAVALQKDWIFTFAP